MLDVDQQRPELPAAPLVAADGQRAQRVAVIALPPRDERGALRLPDLDEVLPRHLERRLDRLGAAAHEVHVAHPGRRRADQPVGELLGHLGREEARVRVGEPVGLRVHRRQHVGMPVTEAGHRGAAAGIEVLLAGGVGDEHAAAGDGDGRRAAKVAVQDVRHGGLAVAIGPLLCAKKHSASATFSATRSAGGAGRRMRRLRPILYSESGACNTWQVARPAAPGPEWTVGRRRRGEVRAPAGPGICITA